jgi:hypothetical protein
MVKLAEVDLPIVFKHQPLFKSGTWNPDTNNNFEFTPRMVDNSVKNTKWSSLNKRLYLKHSGAFDVSKWKGNVENIESKDGTVYGDVEIWDADEGVQILYGKKPVAISADISFNHDGILFYKGFAIENDPGVRDSKMFLSDAVKDELSGMYHASFSSELDTTLVMQQNAVTQPNTINNHSSERRLNETVNMESQNNSPVVNQPQNTQPVINVNTSGADSELVRQLAEKLAVLEEKDKHNTMLIESIKNTQVAQPSQGTVADSQLKTVIPTDDASMDNFVNKVVEKIKPSLVAQSMTTNEFSGQKDNVPGDQKTINRLAAYFEKKNE